MSKELLRLENVSKSFGGIRALNNVNLIIKEGEKLAIIGPNGAGKTTLFNAISGVFGLDSGRIFYMGRDITKLPPFKRKYLGISRAFQIPRPFAGMTVLDNVVVGALFSRDIKDIMEARVRAEEILSLVGLHSKKDELAVNLTSPEKKLLELARALAPKPKLLLLDEIVAGIPPAEVDKIMGLVVRISKQENISVVALVEHVMRVLKYVERAVFLHEGRVMMDDTPDKVLNSEVVKDIYLGKVYE
jgi:branched-chain amino acid transport system ATP-binding protein